MGTLIDALSQVNGIKINSVSFDIFDKIKLQTEARAAAFKEAKEKARDFAEFAGLKLERVIKISDFQRVSAPPILQARAVGALASPGPSTSVPIGNLDVNYRTDVTFVLRI